MLSERVETTSMEYDSTIQQKYLVMKSYFRVKSFKRDNDR